MGNSPHLRPRSVLIEGLPARMPRYPGRSLGVLLTSLLLWIGVGRRECFIVKRTAASDDLVRLTQYSQHAHSCSTDLGEHFSNQNASELQHRAGRPEKTFEENRQSTNLWKKIRVDDGNDNKVDVTGTKDAVIRIGDNDLYIYTKSLCDS
ncbi:hypothetical protein GGR57DRAFT_261420 [Xylariaceae sp. FL1272]|nr:hypothetical protein GGR57DRAFT_261420 [Xylariaceae sp. FL1272]